MTTWRKHLVIAIAASFALRLWMVFATKDIRIVADGKFQIWGDAYFYHHSANLVADGVGFVNPLKYNKFGVVAQAADHPPLFIIYLSLFSILGLQSIVAHQLATGLIGIILVVAIAQFARTAFGERVGTIALWLAAVSPLLWSWDKMLWSEPLAMLLVVLTVLSSLRAARNATTVNVVLLGVVAGCATLARAELLLSGLLCIGMVLLVHHRSIAKSVVACACLLAVLSPWVFFNLSRFDETVILSNGLDIVIPTDNCASTYRGPLVAYWDITCAQDAIDAAERRFPNADESVVNAEIRRIGVDFIKDNKRRAAEVAALRELRVLGIYRPLQQMRLDHFPEGKDRAFAVLSWMNYYVLVPFAVAGFIMTIKRQRILAFICAAPVVTALTAVAISAGITRYRASADPILVILAALAISASVDFVLRQWNAPAPHE